MVFIPAMRYSSLITGGARSGKSVFAENLTLSKGDRAIYIATAESFDSEMEARIQAHQDRRGPEWDTLYAPVDLLAALTQSDGSLPRLVDCLTLWVSNMMLADLDWRSAATQLAATIKTQKAPVIFVTNEVGMGIVPENKLARQFRDAAGWVNQTIAAEVDELYFCVSGYPMKVKP
jgi:adenosylcobinamide kinase/adenosylcobinamide-phosphate guanylyltransferase